MSRTKRTRPRLDALVQGLEGGMTRRAACAWAGFHHAQLYRWMRASDAVRVAVETAEGKAEARFGLQVLKAATDGTWQAAAWWLERRRPDDYAQRGRIDLRMELASEVDRIAAEKGLDRDEVMEEVRRLLPGALP
jgi:hypothetical protein